MRYPSFLPENGTIGFIAPAFGCKREPYHSAFLSALDSFREMGYEHHLGPNCFKDKGIGISNTPKACADEFMRFYTSKKNDILLSCGGGEEMCEILPFIDWKRIDRARPKWFMGYSDNTNIGFLLATRCDTASIYGPNGPTFGMEPWHPALDDAMGVLTGYSAKSRESEVPRFELHSYDLYETESLKDEENPLAPWNVTEPVEIRTFPGENASFSGRLLGGCLDCLSNLCGTRFDFVKDFNERYRKDGVIWFLEACDLNVFGIRRALWQLREAGWFDCAAGFMIGRPLNGEEMFGLDHFDAVLDILGPLDQPIIMDMDIGHVAPLMPLITGSMAHVEAGDGQATVRMELR